MTWKNSDTYSILVSVYKSSAFTQCGLSVWNITEMLGHSTTLDICCRRGNTVELLHLFE